MTEKQRHNISMKIIVGIGIIAFGVLALLSNFGVPLNFNMRDYWPLILIIIGLGFLVQPLSKRHFFNGIIILAIGGFFLARNLVEGFDFRIHDLWPVILVIVGIKILTCGFRHPRRHRPRFTQETIDSKDYLDFTANLSGGKFIVKSKELKGGKLSAVMGECNVNLRDADFQEETLVLDISAIMGAVIIMVPENWEIVIQGSPFMGAIEDKTKHSSTNDLPKKKLFINGTAMMGSIEIIN